LITVPYLSRVLGPASWGLLAMAQAFATYGGLVIEYGFIYYGTRRVATARDAREIEAILAGVSGARILLSVLVMVCACLAFLYVPLFRHHPVLLWSAVGAEIVKALLPNYYFYGLNRVALASLLDISARVAAAAGIFVIVHGPKDAWRVFALQGAGAFIALLIAHRIIRMRHAVPFPRLDGAVRMLREAGNMFLFRSAHNIYVLGNAFILGLFASPDTVGFYAGAEKINSAAVGLLSPLTTALYPRAAGMAQTSMRRAARLTTVSLYVMGAVSLVLGALMWFGAPLIVRVILGRGYTPSAGVLQILSLRAPLVAWTNVLGFQWLLALGFEKSFQRITLLALVLNVALALYFAPRFGASGMAWVVVVSQAVVAIGIQNVLQRRRVNPFAIQSDAPYA